MSRFKCPACGAALNISRDTGEAVCDYCGCRADIQQPQRKGYQDGMKYCRHCGESIHEKAVICPECGCQVEELQVESVPQREKPVVIERPVYVVREGANVRPKWISFTLCVFLGWMGAHKFYEGKYFWGIVYLLTFAFGGLGWLVDCLVLLFKPNPYYV